MKTIMNQPATPPSSSPFAKRYSDSFKQEALALLAAGRRKTQLARELGVSIWTLGEWEKRASVLPATNARQPLKNKSSAATLQAELSYVRKQLAQAQLHAEILKKALAIVGKEEAVIS